MNDLITIEDLEVHYRVGVPDEERAQPQRLLLTLELRLDVSAAAAADDLARTVDYAAVCARLQAWGRGREWRLIERLAVEIADLVLEEFPPRRVAVQVKKFILPQTRWVGVRVERARATGQ